MTLNLNVPQTIEQLTPRITVIGVGGAGGNAVNNMIQNNLQGVEFLVANTDSQALAQSLCERSVQLGRNVTQGLGAGSRPDIGRAAAEEVLDDIMSQLEGCNMIFVTAGMGGGTGTGAAPVLARASREAGILTVGVVTKPFHFEGVHRMRTAEAGIQELQQFVDTLIVIPNQNLFRVANEKTTFADAFKMADDVLDSGVRGVTDLMVMPGLINLDFADIRAVMSEMGKAMMGTGEADGDNRAIEAAEAAISNPLLDDVSMKGARGVLINITGGGDMTLFEVDEAANRIRDEVDPDANIIFGSTFVESIEGRMRCSVVATGIDAEAMDMPRPAALSLVSSRASAPEPKPEPAPAAEPRHEPAAEAAEAAASRMSAEAETSREPERIVTRAEIVEPRPETPAETPAEAPAEPARVEEVAAAERPETVAPPAEQPEPRAPLFATAPARPSPVVEQEEFLKPRRDEEDEAWGPMGRGRKRAQSFLARVSGAARAIQGSTPEPERAPSPQPSRDVDAAPRAAHRPAPEPVQPPRHAVVESREPEPESKAEEELLDIPAFLRRQAN